MNTFDLADQLDIRIKAFDEDIAKLDNEQKVIREAIEEERKRHDDTMKNLERRLNKSIECRKKMFKQKAYLYEAMCVLVPSRDCRGCVNVPAKERTYVRQMEEALCDEST
jgi:hypothetical protein